MKNDNPFLEKIPQGKRNYIALIITISAAIITLLAIFYFFVFSPNEVNGPSMLPNYNDNDIVLVSRPFKWLYGSDFSESLGIGFKRDDVVVFNLKSEGDVVKRIIGLPGETISMRNGYIYIDDIQYTPNYQVINILNNDGAALRNNIGSITLGSDEFFLMGDNRDVSYDSREIGPVKIDDIKGKVIFKIWPM